MPELTITRGPGAGTTIALRPDQAYSLGSGDQDSLQLAGAGIVPNHAIVKALKSGGFGIKAIGGTFQHNGEDVQVSRLADGDQVDLGTEVTLRYAETESARAPQESASQIAPEEPVPQKAAPQKAAPQKAAPQKAAPQKAAPQKNASPASSRSSGADTPSEIGGFKLFEQVGKGGMGVVYRAEQVSLGREVALKVLSRDLTKDPEFIEKFVAEARAAAQLHHPNVVQVFDVDNASDIYFYSMELMAHGSLEDRLKRDKKVPVDEAVQMIRDAASGLGFAESMRIVHRDIKPDNLMVDQHGNVKIADLGLAQVDDDNTGDGGKLFGTPHFMSPEQIQRKSLDHRSDLYSLGCTFYRLVTGRSPCKGSNVKEILRAQVFDAPEPAHKVEPSVPADVSATIDKMLAKDPDERFQTAAECIEALDAAAAPQSSNRVLIGAIAAAVLVAVSAVIYALTREDTIIIQKPDDDGQRLAGANDADTAAKDAELREMAAELAYSKATGDGLELAKMLDQVAAEHAGTKWAVTATEKAEALRATAAADEAAASERASQIGSAVDTVSNAVRSALESGDFQAAAQALTLSDIDEALRSAPELSTISSTLTTELAEAGAARLAEVRGKISKAAEGGDAEAIRTNLVVLDGILSGPGAWPNAALGERAPLEEFAKTTRAQIADIVARARSKASEAAWQAAANALLGEGGIATDLRTLHMQEAAQKARDQAESIGADTAAGARLRKLAGAATAGARYLAARRSTHPNDVPDSALDIEDLGAAFPASDDSQASSGDAEDFDRGAFLALTAIAVHSERVQTYLRALKPDDDNSGTGDEESFTPGLTLFDSSLQRLLEASTQAWSNALLSELLAARTTARALSAFSARRNTAAADAVERALAQYPDTFVVRCLR